MTVFLNTSTPGSLGFKTGTTTRRRSAPHRDSRRPHHQRRHGPGGRGLDSHQPRSRLHPDGQRQPNVAKRGDEPEAPLHRLPRPCFCTPNRSSCSRPNLGPPIGAALGIAFGARIAAAFSWRRAFLLVGAAGVVAALAVLFIVQEPRRGGLDDGGQLAASKPGFWQTFAMFFSRRTTVLAALGSGATQFITYGLGNFTTLFLMREKGMSLNEVALYYALVVGIAMTSGVFVSGRLIDRFTQRSKQAYGLLPAASLALAVPFYVGFVWADSWRVALLFLIFPSFLNYFYLSSSVALVQEEVRPEQRAMSGALLLLVMNFIGLGLGPTYVGAASDYFRAGHPGHSLQFALYTLLPFYGVAIILFLWLARVLRHEIRDRGGAVDASAS